MRQVILSLDQGVCGRIKEHVMRACGFVVHYKREKKLSAGNIVLIECGLPQIGSGRGLFHMKMATAVNLTEKAAAEIDVANNGGINGSNLRCFGVDPDGGVGMSEQFGSGVVRAIAGIWFELQFFEDAAISNFAGQPGELAGAQDGVDEAGAVSLPFLLLGEDSALARIVRVNRHLQDVFPVAQLALV